VFNIFLCFIDVQCLVVIGEWQLGSVTCHTHSRSLLLSKMAFFIGDGKLLI